jgi:hypothetical protein
MLGILAVEALGLTTSANQTMVGWLERFRSGLLLQRRGQPIRINLRSKVCSSEAMYSFKKVKCDE